MLLLFVRNRSKQVADVRVLVFNSSLCSGYFLSTTESQWKSCRPIAVTVFWRWISLLGSTAFKPISTASSNTLDAWSRDAAGRTPEDGKPSEVLGPWPEVEGPAWRLRLLEGQSLSPPIQHDNLERLFTLPPPSLTIRQLRSPVLKTFILYYTVRINLNIFDLRIHSMSSFGLIKLPLSCY